MDIEFIKQRITDLRIKQGVSEYKMNLDLGHSRSYIQSIASGRALPSLPEFLYICEYLHITPSAFFDSENKAPILVQKAVEGMHSLSDKDMLMLIGIIERLKDEPAEK